MGRLRATLGPSSLRATAMFLPPKVTSLIVALVRMDHPSEGTYDFTKGLLSPRSASVVINRGAEK
jgi:hypothetical protein